MSISIRPQKMRKIVSAIQKKNERTENCELYRDFICTQYISEGSVDKLRKFFQKYEYKKNNLSLITRVMQIAAEKKKLNVIKFVVEELCIYEKLVIQDTLNHSIAFGFSLPIVEYFIKVNEQVKRRRVQEIYDIDQCIDVAQNFSRVMVINELFSEKFRNIENTYLKLQNDINKFRVQCKYSSLHGKNYLETMFGFACRNKDLKMIRLLHSDVRKQLIEEEYIEACDMGHLDLARYFLEECKVNVFTDNGNAFRFSYKKHLELFEYLFKFSCRTYLGTDDYIFVIDSIVVFLFMYFILNFFITIFWG